MTRALRSPRLALRPVEGDADIAAIAHWMTDYDVARWLTQVPWPYTAEDAAWFVNDHAGASSTGDHWALDAGAGLIGVVSLGSDLGYWLAKPFHGRGYMSEAVGLVLADAFDRGAERLTSGHYPGNVASRHVLVKHGFTDTHEDRVIRHADRKPQTVQRMVLTKEAWQAARLSLAT